MAFKKNLKALFIIVLFAILFLSFVSSRPIDCKLDNPIASWQFNEGNGTNAQDSCYGYNTTFYGSLEWSNSTPYNNTLKFNGIDSYVDAGNFFNQSMQEFSFSLWTNMSYKIAYQTLFQSGNYYTNEFIEALQVNEGDNDYVVFMSVNSIGYSPIDDGIWHHIAGTFNGSDNGNVSLYIDGVPIASVLTYQAQIDATTNPLYFGVNYANGYVLDGFLDEISFYNRTLNPEEVKSINHSFIEGSNMSLILYAQDYPYVDFNTSYPIKVKLFKNGIELSDAVVYMEITDPYSNITPLYLIYNPISEFYEANIIFTLTGDYPFFIEANSLAEGYINATGLFSVRKSFYITFEGFTNTLEDEYINNFAFVTAELTENRRYDASLEPFFAPLTPSSIYGRPAWWAEYEDGSATLKLWEKNRTYAVRLIDGIITFNSNYAIPNISKSYGTNAYINSYYFNGTNQTYRIVFSEKDLQPYRWLFNWVLIIGLAMSIIVALFMLFLIPDKPVIALSFAVLIAGGVILLRILVWLWQSW